jgi:hypothetical protein
MQGLTDLLLVKNTTLTVCFNSERDMESKRLSKSLFQNSKHKDRAENEPNVWDLFYSYKIKCAVLTVVSAGRKRGPFQRTVYAFALDTGEKKINGEGNWKRPYDFYN